MDHAYVEHSDLPPGSMDAMIAGIRQRAEEKIAAAVLETSPFPHLIIGDFLPPNVYQLVLAYNPFIENAGEEWMSKAASANVKEATPYHARKQINLHKTAPFRAAPEAAEFWGAIQKCFLGDSWFTTLVKRKYPAFFNIRFGDLADDPAFAAYFRTELFLQRHEPGFRIGPHTDIATRVFTGIFAFAERPGFEEYGTELLAPKNPLARCWGSDHYAPDDFIIRKIAPYRPNHLLLFFKTRQSFHSVKPITADVPNQRYGMQFQLCEPCGGVFQDLSKPDLMRLKQRPPPPTGWKRYVPATARRWARPLKARLLRS